jgi:hypothetical protein
MFSFRWCLDSRGLGIGKCIPSSRSGDLAYSEHASPVALGRVYPVCSRRLCIVTFAFRLPRVCPETECALPCQATPSSRSPSVKGLDPARGSFRCWSNRCWEAVRLGWRCREQPPLDSREERREGEPRWEKEEETAGVEREKGALFFLLWYFYFILFSRLNTAIKVTQIAVT